LHKPVKVETDTGLRDLAARTHRRPLGLLAYLGFLAWVLTTSVRLFLAPATEGGALAA
jgi:hypothetical protein